MQETKQNPSADEKQKWIVGEGTYVTHRLRIGYATLNVSLNADERLLLTRYRRDRISFFVFSIKNNEDGRIIAESQRRRAASDFSVSEGPQ